MPDIVALLQQGTASAWLFVPSAMLLGALHGLEPGHSKTMMAAFIIAIRGTVAQAIMLGVAATVSHTAVVWVVALIALHYGSHWSSAATEPYFQIGSAVLIVGVAVWMMWRTARRQRTCGHDHGEQHHQGPQRIDTGHGVLRLEIFEHNSVAHFRIHAEDRQGQGLLAPASVSVVTERADGSLQTFHFVQREGFVESAEEIPEPHDFVARLRLGHDHHHHDYDLEFTEHGHPHAIGDYARMDVSAPGYQDPHELAHANDIRHRFTDRQVTNGQILIFGLTGGLVPCPATITVLLICLQLRQFTLGALLVLCFSVGLALTLVTAGVVAALSVRHLSTRWAGFGELARKAPLFSGAVILIVGLYVGFQGLQVLLR